MGKIVRRSGCPAELETRKSTLLRDTIAGRNAGGSVFGHFGIRSTQMDGDRIRLADSSPGIDRDLHAPQRFSESSRAGRGGGDRFGRPASATPFPSGYAAYPSSFVAEHYWIGMCHMRNRGRRSANVTAHVGTGIVRSPGLLRSERFAHPAGSSKTKAAAGIALVVPAMNR
jgi:hypothetical protein